MLRFENALIRQDDFGLKADFALNAGALAALIGPSGAGKSTLLAALAGFAPLAGGRISWRGEDLAPLGPGARPVTILFQDQNLFPHLTIKENLALGIAPRLRISAGESARIEAALERVGLSGLGGRKPATLSGGQQGRAALARALLRARPILALDEPFAALGPAMRRDMLSLVREIATETGATVLIVTHDPEEARALGGCAIPVAEGHAGPASDARALLDKPPPALAAYLGK